MSSFETGDDVCVLVDMWNMKQSLKGRRPRLEGQSKAAAVVPL